MSRFLPALIPLLLLLLGCADKPYRALSPKSSDPFYQEDKDHGYSGQKKLLDRVYQLDPGQSFFKCSPYFLQDPPRKLAFLPFENLKGGDFLLNGMPLTERKGEDKKAWSWTYSNRLRKFLFAHFALREFELLGLLETDTILQELGITNPKRLYKTDPKDLGRALGVDAVIYGKVTHYESHYYLLFTQVVVGLYIRCVSTHDGSTLFEVAEVRRDNNLRIATNPIDFAAGSVQNVMALRDLYRIKAADEACREIVARVPVAESLKVEKEHKWKTRLASDQKIKRIRARLMKTETYITDGGGEEPTKPGHGSSPRLHRVQKGDTLFKLARKYYNDESQWKTIYKANQGSIKDKDHLVPGETLVIPPLPL